MASIVILAAVSGWMVLVEMTTSEETTTTFTMLSLTTPCTNMGAYVNNALQLRDPTALVTRRITLEYREGTVNTHITLE